MKKWRLKTSDIQEIIAKKTSLLLATPSACFVCGAVFDKKDKEATQTWRIVADSAAGLIRLYCPTCWQTAETWLESAKESVQR
jgi:hypothetical protein